MGVVGRGVGGKGVVGSRGRWRGGKAERRVPPDQDKARTSSKAKAHEKEQRGKFNIRQGRM
jgi:hypothetical protein